MKPLSESVKAKYTDIVNQHISYVRQAGMQIGVPAEQLTLHDASKWSEEEFEPYARHFCGDKDDPDGFALAWLHHQNNNPHHWEYWISRSVNFRDIGSMDGNLIRMPDNYVLEMVADWMGASRAYTGSWDMTDWLNNNLVTISLHKDSWITLREILNRIGYTVVSDDAWIIWEVTRNE